MGADPEFSCTESCTDSWHHWFGSLCGQAARRTLGSSCCATNSVCCAGRPTDLSSPTRIGACLGGLRLRFRDQAEPGGWSPPTRCWAGTGAASPVTGPNRSDRRVSQAARNLLLRYGRRRPGARARPRKPVRRRLRRDLQDRRLQGPQHTSAHARGERVRRTLDRHPAPRDPRPHHHLEPTPTQQARRRLHRALQQPPTPPLARPTTPSTTPPAERQHLNVSPSHQHDTIQRTHQRVPTCGLTSHNTISGTHTLGVVRRSGRVDSGGPHRTTQR